ncbi:hypothetical protein [Wohlfahrtiimonas chitiniclastica]|uniref:hypothetical protein n=1 Tax=Wohlfahrtiimonas chitiniclastica TaxID=400946 RepID=UPI00036EA0FB|nr:hypothetical protein [Wohlfahrtiimonas chitiniclastica]
MINAEISKNVEKFVVFNEMSQFDMDKMHLISANLHEIIPRLSNDFYLDWQSHAGMYFPELSESMVKHLATAWLRNFFDCPNSAHEKYANTLWALGELQAHDRLAPVVMAAIIPFMQSAIEQFIQVKDHAIAYHVRLELATSLFKTLAMNENILYHCVAY